MSTYNPFYYESGGVKLPQYLADVFNKCSVCGETWIGPKVYMCAVCAEKQERKDEAVHRL